jgi:hypothetical protein
MYTHTHTHTNTKHIIRWVYTEDWVPTATEKCPLKGWRWAHIHSKVASSLSVQEISDSDIFNYIPLLKNECIIVIVIPSYPGPINMPGY